MAGTDDSTNEPNDATGPDWLRVFLVGLCLVSLVLAAVLAPSLGGTSALGPDAVDGSSGETPPDSAGDSGDQPSGDTSDAGDEDGASDGADDQRSDEPPDDGEASDGSRGGAADEPDDAPPGAADGSTDGPGAGDSASLQQAAPDLEYDPEGGTGDFGATNAENGGTDGDTGDDAGAGSGTGDSSGDVTSGVGQNDLQDEHQVGGPISEERYQEAGSEVVFVADVEGSGYWRQGAYDTYTGDGWERSADYDRFSAPNGPSARERTVSQTVELRTSLGFVPGAWQIADVEGAGDRSLERGTDGSVRPDEAFDAGTTLTVESHQSTADADRLRSAGTAYDAAIREQYTTYPRGASERVRQFTTDLTADDDTPYDQARTIEQWIQQEKAYDLGASHDPDRPMVEQVVFAMDGIYCDYAASAMTVMLRSQGVPARYVQGYSPGVAVDGVQVVTQQNAHAWVEVYFPDEGWIRFDPTPSSDRQSAMQQELADDGDELASAADEFDSEGRGSGDGGAGDTGGTSGGSGDTSEGGDSGSSGESSGGEGGDDSPDGERSSGDGDDGSGGSGESSDPDNTEGGDTGSGEGGDAERGEGGDTESGSEDGDSESDGEAGDGDDGDSGSSEGETSEGSDGADDSSWDDEWSDDDRSTQGDDGAPQPPYDVAVEDPVVPGTSVDVAVTKDGEPVRGATVSFDGTVVGETDENGRVAGTVPFVTELSIEVTPPGEDPPSGDRSNGLVAGGAPIGSGAGGGAGAFSAPAAAPQSSENVTRSTVATESGLEIRADDVALPGETLALAVRVADHAVEGAAVSIAGDRVGRTDENGTATVELPAEPGTYSITVERGELSAERSVAVRSLNASVDALVLLPGRSATVSVDHAGEPVEDATVAVDGETVATETPNGTAAVSLPVAPTTDVRVESGSATAETTVTGLYRNAALLALAALVSVGGGLALVARRSGAGRARASGLVARVIATVRRVGHRTVRLLRWMVRRPVEVAVALGRVLDAAARRFAAWCRALPSTVLRGLRRAWRLLRRRGVGLLRLLDPRRLARLLYGLVRSAGKHSTASAGAGARESSEGAGGAQAVDAERRVTLRTLWNEFLDLLRPPKRRTWTPGEMERYAVSRGFPRAPVRTIVRAFREVEYGRTQATSDRIERVRTAVGSIEDGSGATPAGDSGPSPAGDSGSSPGGDSDAPAPDDSDDTDAASDQSSRESDDASSLGASSRDGSPRDRSQHDGSQQDESSRDASRRDGSQHDGEGKNR